MLRKVETVRVLALYGGELVFQSVADAVEALTTMKEGPTGELRFVKFEVQLRFSDGDRIEGSFQNREDALEFLRKFS